MSNRISILRRSALPEATKVATMVAEIHRRWKNTWEGANTSTFGEITKSFMDDLCSMGYTEQWRREILLKATRGYMRILKLQKKGETLRNRPAAMTQLKRRYKKLTGQKDWFQEDDEMRLTESEETKNIRSGQRKNSRRIETV